jgi:hypothetical protein
VLGTDSISHPVTALVRNFSASDCLTQPGTEGGRFQRLGRFASEGALTEIGYELDDEGERRTRQEGAPFVRDRRRLPADNGLEPPTEMWSATGGQTLALTVWSRRCLFRCGPTWSGRGGER